MELWLIRHGETEWSLSGAHTSRTDIPLTSRGREQARSLRPLLSNTTFDAVLMSPMLRARETCELTGFGDQAVVNDALKEWDYGVYEGRTTRDIQEEIPGWSVWSNEVTEGETVENVGMRADNLIREALGAAPRPGRLAFFAHAHILRILAARWVGLSPESGKHFTLGTASVSVLGWEREIPAIVRWNQQGGS